MTRRPRAPPAQRRLRVPGKGSANRTSHSSNSSPDSLNTKKSEVAGICNFLAEEINSDAGVGGNSCSTPAPVGVGFRIRGRDKKKETANRRHKPFRGGEGKHRVFRCTANTDECGLWLGLGKHETVTERRSSKVYSCTLLGGLAQIVPRRAGRPT